MGSQKKSLKIAKIPLQIDPSQNQDLSTSLESPYKKLLNATFDFEIRHS